MQQQRSLIAPLAVLLVAIGLLLGPGAGPAHACSCIQSTDAEAFDRADAVFVGEVIDFEQPGSAEPASSDALATWTFGVSEVFKGEVTAVQQIVSSVSSASCGAVFDEAAVHIVFANLEEGDGSVRLASSLCSGNRSIAEGPLDVEVTPSTPISPQVQPPAAPSGDGPDDGGRSYVPLAAGAAAAVAAVGLVVGIRRSRSS